ncbi:MAG: RpiB/LacA/LacB family sugar-phosphate isomerase, partial [Actinobacteria bacterium]|nr:RpiB/LacA/LacB family sugar-phosphate isomerase [Actinomycetota bacterium]
VDHGPVTYEALDDYPTFCLRAAEGVAKNSGSLGIVLGGSGNGEQISANKVVGIRAALAYNSEIAALARQHNNANVLSIGERMNSQIEALEIVDAFLATPFSGEDRHTRRIEMISDYEVSKKLPPL